MSSIVKSFNCCFATLYTNSRFNSIF